MKKKNMNILYLIKQRSEEERVAIKVLRAEFVRWVAKLSDDEKNRNILLQTRIKQFEKYFLQLVGV